jgi:hypothetical protein
VVDLFELLFRFVKILNYLRLIVLEANIGCFALPYEQVLEVANLVKA